MRLKEFLSLYEESKDRIDFIFLRKAAPEDSFCGLKESEDKKYYRFHFTLEELLGDKPKLEDFPMLNKEDFESAILKHYLNGQEFLKREVESFTLEEDWMSEENFDGDMEYDFNAINILIVLKD